MMRNRPVTRPVRSSGRGGPDLMSSQNEAGMELRIKECAENGTFEVVQVKPVTLASFVQKEHAQLFCASLIEAAPAANSAERPPEQVPEPDPIQTGEDTDQADDDAPIQVDKSLTVPETVEDVAAEFEDNPEPWTPGELDRAFELLEQGKPLLDVAAWHGKSWQSLRGKWASRQRHKKKAQPEEATALVPVEEPVQTPLAKVIDAVAELSEQEKCRICERHFTPTLDNLDLCARCNHGT